jgi:hypothetical protein
MWLKPSIYTEENLKKYASLDKEALLKRAALADWVMGVVKKAFGLLSTFAGWFSSNSRLSQAFNMIAEAIEEWEQNKN